MIKLKNSIEGIVESTRKKVFPLFLTATMSYSMVFPVIGNTRQVFPAYELKDKKAMKKLLRNKEVIIYNRNQELRYDPKSGRISMSPPNFEYDDKTFSDTLYAHKDIFSWTVYDVDNSVNLSALDINFRIGQDRKIHFLRKSDAEIKREKIQDDIVRNRAFKLNLPTGHDSKTLSIEQKMDTTHLNKSYERIKSRISREPLKQQTVSKKTPVANNYPLQDTAKTKLNGPGKIPNIVAQNNQSKIPSPTKSNEKIKHVIHKKNEQIVSQKVTAPEKTVKSSDKGRQITSHVSSPQRKEDHPTQNVYLEPEKKRDDLSFSSKSMIDQSKKESVPSKYLNEIRKDYRSGFEIKPEIRKASSNERFLKYDSKVTIPNLESIISVNSTQPTLKKLEIKPQHKSLVKNPYFISGIVGALIGGVVAVNSNKNNNNNHPEEPGNTGIK